MKLQNAYIIDREVFEKLEKLVNSKENSFTNNGRLQIIQELKQHLKPALPIVEQAFDEGSNTPHKAGSARVVFDNSENQKKAKQQFLTKEF